MRAGAQAGLPALPKCKSDSLPPLACLDGESFASAFGVGTAQPRTAAIHQWPYSTYTAVRAILPVAVARAADCSCLGWQGRQASLADRRPISPNCGTGRADSTGCPHTMAYAIRTARYRYIASVGAPPPAD